MDGCPHRGNLSLAPVASSCMDDALVDNTGVMTFCVLASMYVLEGKMLDFTNVLTRVEITEGERYKKGGGRVHAP